MAALRTQAESEQSTPTKQLAKDKRAPKLAKPGATGLGSGNYVRQGSAGGIRQAKTGMIDSRQWRGNPWEFQMGWETPNSFTMFSTFRDMGPSRTIMGLARKINKSQGYMAGYSAKFLWWCRAAAFDAWVDKIKNEEFADEAGQMARRQARLGMKMQAVAEDRLEQFAESPELRETLTAPDVIRLASEGQKIERQARGESTGESKDQTIIFAFNGAPPPWVPANAPMVDAAQLEEGDAAPESKLAAGLPGTVASVDGPIGGEVMSADKA